MDLADWVHGVIIDMNGLLDHHPKYVDIFRKVYAGMVMTASKLFTFVFPSQLYVMK